MSLRPVTSLRTVGPVDRRCTAARSYINLPLDFEDQDMQRIVITGGAGFAGSHIVDKFQQRYPTSEIIVFDRMTYAGDVRNLMPHLVSGRVRLVVADVAELDACMRIVEGADLVVHAAAESHHVNAHDAAAHIVGRDQLNERRNHCKNAHQEGARNKQHHATQ